MISEDTLLFLSNYGYDLDKIHHEVLEQGNNSIIKFLTRNTVPFFIVYCLENDCPIEQTYEMFENGNDAFCTLFMISENGNNSFYTKNVKIGQFSQIKELINYTSINNEELFPQSTFSDKNFENIFFDAHSYLRDLDGLHPDEALDELCKLIYVKLYDEEQNLYYFNRFYGNSLELASSIRKLYKDANEYDVRVYSLKIPGYKRSRGVFDNPILLSSAAISKTVRLFSKFNFSTSDIDFKSRAFQNVYLPTTRAGMGQYFTPLQVVRFIINCIRPKHTDLIIDPFSGSGHFLTESLRFVQNNEQSDKMTSEFIFYKLHGIEKSERMVRIAMTDMRLHGDGHSNIRCTDALLSFDSYTDLSENSFDIVMTNPPFGSNLQKDSYSFLGDFETIKMKQKIPLEILGLERAVQLLRPNGRLGIVLPDSILVNDSNSFIRNWISKNLKIRGIISLPLATFTPFGANIKTSVLFASKKQVLNDYNIFTAFIENIGFDNKGKEIEGADWQKVAEAFNNFIEKEGW